ncbi:hypothetical protein N7509_001185 [Penicillium cosmopolitanum]|uniref:Methyltransferase domain-containing protein n=1 Tax=Penicillium cosmopolitanum TaxID=1131564 RepID=A0A9X0BEY0_9EURO|nr:uncharacterized protein N7509_001185 [Penicillium cosmopolitanum]KAJ5414558.1 hypothetical protein N7509_001185 [Penicillium cosmopolitanum]
MLEPVHENGRRYCDSTYFMPNDETELTRLNILHQIYLILLDGHLTTAPFRSNPQSSPRILDIGTGPGDWAIEMSAEFPNAEIIASDIGIFDSGLGQLELPNVDFQLADAQSEWTYHEPFDLVHMRGLSGAFADWGRIYQQAFAHLKPGGFIEVADADPAGDTICFCRESGNGDEVEVEVEGMRDLDLDSDEDDDDDDDSDSEPEPEPEHESKSESQPTPTPTQTNLQKYTTALRTAAKEAGYPRDLEHLRKTALTAAGFVDIKVIERNIPIGLWPADIGEKTLGKMTLIALLEGLEAYALRPLTGSGKWSLDEARALCELVKEEVLAAEGLRVKVRVVTGRKPVSFAQKRKDVLARARARARFFREKGTVPGDGDGDGEGVDWDFGEKDHHDPS